MSEPDMADLRRRMDGAVDVLRQELGGLRTGRASPALLEPVTVDAYGARMPMNQVGTISAPDARLLSVQVWDQSLVAAVERAIRDADLGLNPQTEGAVIRIPIPQLSEERRAELAKVAAGYAEQAKVAVRNIRRDGIDFLKRSERDGEMSQDEHRAWADEIQEMTDQVVKEIDGLFKSREAEIMQV